MKVVTPEGYTFVTKFQEDNSHKVLRSVEFFSIKFDEIFFDTVCWVMRDDYTVFNNCAITTEELGCLIKHLCTS